MRMLNLIAALSASVAAVAWVACTPPCNTVGCDLASAPMEDVDLATGIAGVAFSLSDVVANGCQECGLTDGRLELIGIDEPIASADTARDLLTLNTPDDVISFSDNYAETLEAGVWLICSRGVEGTEAACVSIDIAEGEVFTVHLSYPFGPPSLVVFDPSGTQLGGVIDVTGI
jgi:hypothetical protein